jgi:hypothetical protein
LEADRNTLNGVEAYSLEEADLNDFEHKAGLL